MTEINYIYKEDIFLEPCPFCGSEAKLTARDNGIASYWFVECTNCHARSKESLEAIHKGYAWERNTYKDRLLAWGDAAKAWNMRDTDHTADVSKKVSISCGHENDVISREAAIEALARMMPRSYTPDGSHPADEEIFRAQEVFADCIEALEILPSAQPEIIRCKDCKHRDPEDKKCDCGHDIRWQLPRHDDWHCADAERRTD